MERGFIDITSVVKLHCNLTTTASKLTHYLLLWTRQRGTYLFRTFYNFNIINNLGLIIRFFRM